MLEIRLRKLAATIIEKADRPHPADSVLREKLKAEKGLTRDESKIVSHAVFSYFRWFGWLNQSSIESAVDRALEYDKSFSMNPESFADAELQSKTVPLWVNEFVDVSPQWLRSLQREPSLWLRAKVGAGDRVARRLGHCDIVHPTLPDTVRYDGREDLYRSADFQAGDFELQDINSQIVSLICAPKAGETWWDACAGEGGKMLHLSDLMQNKGLIWASDRADWRLRKLKQRAGRASAFNYRSVLWDGGAKLPTKTKFHGVLVDAPCSGVGTWQRNPHARWTTTVNDIRELAEIQSNILMHAAESLRPGGKLIYSVCTLTRNETSDVVAKFEKQFPQFQPLIITNPLQPGKMATNHVWLWPQETEGNGMFISAWQKPA